VHQISTIGRLEICTSASAAKGNVEKAYLQKMLVIHITVYHHLQDGGRKWRSGAPKEHREVIAISEWTSLLMTFRGKARRGRPGIVYMSFQVPFFLKCSCLPLRFAYTCGEVSRLSVQKSAGHNDFEAGELNTLRLVTGCHRRRNAEPLVQGSRPVLLCCLGAGA
jgi:hypothetical protein